ncbi:MAG: hypothetical protein CL607_20160 [Anaerolineaceae bacterium]|nr:hypothetical protein [Anaerolineaceae bacterium]
MSIEFVLYAIIAAVAAYFSSEIGDFLVGLAGHERQSAPMATKQRLLFSGMTLAIGLAIAATITAREQALLWFALLVYFMLIAVIDLRYRLVLNLMTYPGLLVAVALNLALFDGQWRSIIIGGIFAFGIFFGAAWFSGGVGGGDIKLASVIGLLFGFPLVTPALLIGGGAGAIYAVALMRQPAEVQKGKAFAYAPFLCFGVLVTFLYVIIGG